jgi:hypothetical protein
VDALDDDHSQDCRGWRWARGPGGGGRGGRAPGSPCTSTTTARRSGGPVYGHGGGINPAAELRSAGGRVVVHQGATVWGVFEQRTLAIWEGESRGDGATRRGHPRHGRPRAMRAHPGLDTARRPRHRLSARSARRSGGASGSACARRRAGPLLPVVREPARPGRREVVAALDAASSRGAPRTLAAPWGQWALSGDPAADWHALRAAGVRLVSSRTAARVVGTARFKKWSRSPSTMPGAPSEAPRSASRSSALCLVWGAVPSIQPLPALRRRASP